VRRKNYFSKQKTI